jgi:hypothetical protein
MNPRYSTPIPVLPGVHHSRTFLTLWEKKRGINVEKPAVRKRKKKDYFFYSDVKVKVYNRETGVPMPPTAPQGGCCHRHKNVVGSRQGFLSLLSLMSFAALALNERKTV